MGYIASADTVYAVAYLTEKGRKYLLEKNPLFSITQFCLADSDVNYIEGNKLSTGQIPDISGKNETSIKGTYKKDIRNRIIYSTSGGIIDPISSANLDSVELIDEITAVPLGTTELLLNIDLITPSA